MGIHLQPSRLLCATTALIIIKHYAGDTLQWLQDNLEIIEDVSDTEFLAAQVSEDEEGSISFVPAFNGLYSPHWRKDARG